MYDNIDSAITRLSETFEPSSLALHGFCDHILQGYNELRTPSNIEEYDNHLTFRFKQLQELGITGKKLADFYAVTCHGSFTCMDLALRQLHWPWPGRREFYDLFAPTSKSFLLFGGAELVYMIEKGEQLSLLELQYYIQQAHTNPPNKHIAYRQERLGQGLPKGFVAPSLVPEI